MSKSNQPKFPNLAIKKLEEDENENHSNYYKIGTYATSNYFYRYMGLETAILCVKNHSIRFAEPCTWEDKLESRFYMANIFGHKVSKNNPTLFAYCVTNKRNSEAAWKIYANKSIGLNSHCVQFKLNRKKFRDELMKAIGNKYDLYEGVVRYVYEKDLRNLHLSKVLRRNKYVDNELYDIFFNNFDLEHYLNLLLLKNDAFKHEQEIRFFLVPKKNSQKEKSTYGYTILDDFNWSNVIEDVCVDNECTDFEIGLLSSTLADKKINFKKYDVYSNDTNRRTIYVRKLMGEIKMRAKLNNWYVEVYEGGVLVYLRENRKLPALYNCAYNIGFQFDREKENNRSLAEKLLEAYCGNKTSGNIGEYHIECAQNHAINIYRIVNNTRGELKKIASSFNIKWEKNWNTHVAGRYIVKYSDGSTKKVLLK